MSSACACARRGTRFCCSTRRWFGTMRRCTDLWNGGAGRVAPGMRMRRWRLCTASSDERYFMRECRGIWIWGLAIPAIALILAPFTRGISLMLFFLYGPQFGWILRNGRKRGWPLGDAAVYAFFTVLTKFPALEGMLAFYWRRWRGQDAHDHGAQGKLMSDRTPSPGKRSDEFDVLKHVQAGCDAARGSAGRGLYRRLARAGVASPLQAWNWLRCAIAFKFPRRSAWRVSLAWPAKSTSRWMRCWRRKRTWLDAVHILTPPDRHFDAARTALEAGVNVFLEKPMCAAADRLRCRWCGWPRSGPAPRRGAQFSVCRELRATAARCEERRLGD
jgi:hypothetical protein